MTKSTTLKKAAKPPKPYADFPLFAHATKRWCKKIKGKLIYFGPWGDPDGALAKFLDERDAWFAGRNPRKNGRPDGLTIRDLCNRFLTSKERLLAAGDLVEVTFRLHKETCARLVSYFGGDRLVTDVSPDEFERFRSTFAEALAPSTLGGLIIRTRGIFRFADTEGLIDKPIRFGSTFRGPSAKVLLQDRHAKGSRMFEADEIRKLIDAADVHLGAMICLGANCGFGPHDVGRLPLGAVELSSGWCDFARPKTGILRRVPLWPETVEAIRESLKHRPEPRNEAVKPLIFITVTGRAWADARPDNVVVRLFGKLLRVTGLHRPGLGFYGLRRGFETIAGESIDQVAVDHIMGHSRGDMASVYRQRISDERLLAVVNHVRQWLFPADDSRKE